VTAIFIPISICAGNSYEIRGVVLDESQQPTTALMAAAPTNTPTQGTIPVQTSNGLYSIQMDLPQGTVVSIIAMRGTPSGLGGNSWIRTVTLDNQSVISNFNFTVPNVNTSIVSVVGVITVNGSSPQDRTTIAVRKAQPQYGQELSSAQILKIPGFAGGTNAFKFFDLPADDYGVTAKADSSLWTQMVITVTATNIPVHLDIDF
jgi:hypothetical protein